jgi:ATP-dependent Clp protease ATP-binding subunit ClpC
MFERFTDRARRVVVLAQDEARTLQHDYIGTEHVLLGLISVDGGVAARALESLGITRQAVREQVEALVGRGERPSRSGHIPFSGRAKKVLELSLREAIQLGHNYIGTEHILLGLIREADGAAAQALRRLGADLDTVRQQVIELLQQYAHGDAAQRPRHPGEPGAGHAAGGLERGLGDRLETIEARLSAMEQRVGTGPDVSDLDQQITQVRRDKEAAVGAQDFENAARLRDREQELAAEKASRQQQWAAVHPDLPSLSDEVERLRGLLRRHGIEPGDGTAPGGEAV